MNKNKDWVHGFRHWFTVDEEMTQEAAEANSTGVLCRFLKRELHLEMVNLKGQKKERDTTAKMGRFKRHLGLKSYVTRFLNS